MNTAIFDRRVQELGSLSTRRRLFRLFGGAVAAGAGRSLLPGDESLAGNRGKRKSRNSGSVSAQGKGKGKKVSICYQNQTLLVKKKGSQSKYPGATAGACPSAPVLPDKTAPPAPQPVACTTFILSGGPNQTDPIIVDDDMDVFNMATGKFILIDGNEKATTHSPIVFSGQIGHVLRVRAWDSGGCRSLSPLWVHCLATGQKKQIFTGYNAGGCYFTPNMYLDMRFTIEL